MRTKALALGLLASTFLVTAASAQAPATTATPPGASATSTTTAPIMSDQWRASKLIGLDIYNDQNEKLGDISEILIDKAGKVEGVVIGVGGFLGVGTREIKVSMDKLKFVNEPMKATTTSSTTTSGGTTRTASNAPAATTTTTTTSKKQWYPDHAVLSGASKDQLKAMAEFKYE